MRQKKKVNKMMVKIKMVKIKMMNKKMMNKKNNKMVKNKMENKIKKKIMMMKRNQCHQNHYKQELINLLRVLLIHHSYIQEEVYLRNIKLLSVLC